MIILLFYDHELITFLFVLVTLPLTSGMGHTPTVSIVGHMMLTVAWGKLILKPIVYKQATVFIT